MTIKDSPWNTMDTRGVSFRTVRLSPSDRHSTFKGKGAHKSKGYPVSASTRKADAYARNSNRQGASAKWDRG